MHRHIYTYMFIYLRVHMSTFTYRSLSGGGPEGGKENSLKDRVESLFFQADVGESKLAIMRLNYETALGNALKKQVWGVSGKRCTIMFCIS